MEKLLFYYFSLGIELNPELKENGDFRKPRRHVASCKISVPETAFE